MEVIVIGAGIGGLTTALFLNKSGIDCEIWERAPEIQELGVGINLLPHAVGTLAEVGVLDALEAEGVVPEHLYYRTRFGQTVWDEPRGRAAGLPFPQISIHRGRLQRVLYEAALDRLPPGSVHLGRRFEGYEETEDGRVRASFVSAEGIPEAAVCDALIGADGIHSALRAQLFPGEGRPRWSGRVLWRGTTDWPTFGDGKSFIIAGANDARLVLFPIARGQAPGTMLTNWVAAVRVAEDGAPLPSREDWQGRADRGQVLEVLERFSVPELDMVELASACGDIFEFPMCDREPLPRWSFGPVTLLGDAAHPMYPFGGNGAAQAILDAKAVAEALDRAPSAAEGLAGYDGARREKVYQLVMTNRSGGPERVIDAIENRVCGVVADVDTILPLAEREAIVKGYSSLAGFAKEQLRSA